MMRLRRWQARLLFGSVVLVAVFLAPTVRLFVLPPAATPSRTDAVVMLSGERFAEAVRLVTAGVAPILVHAGTPDSQVVRACAPVRRGASR